MMTSVFLYLKDICTAVAPHFSLRSLLVEDSVFRFSFFVLKFLITILSAFKIKKMVKRHRGSSQRASRPKKRRPPQNKLADGDVDSTCTFALRLKKSNTKAILSIIRCLKLQMKSFWQNALAKIIKIQTNVITYVCGRWYQNTSFVAKIRLN